MASGSDWAAAAWSGMASQSTKGSTAKERRSRFANSTKTNNAKSTPKYTKLSQAADFIKEQTGLDINKYRDEATRRFDKRNSILVDYKRMSKTDQQKFGEALRQKYSPYKTEVFGAWGVEIRLKK